MSETMVLAEPVDTSYAGAFDEVALWGAIIRSLVRDVSNRYPLANTLESSATYGDASQIDDQGNAAQTACVEILERISVSSALVSWRDPTRCSYGFQMWHRTLSRRSGICALSGCEIRRGDSVYQP